MKHAHTSKRQQSNSEAVHVYVKHAETHKVKQPQRDPLNTDQPTALSLFPFLKCKINNTDTNLSYHNIKKASQYKHF